MLHYNIILHVWQALLIFYLYTYIKKGSALSALEFKLLDHLVVPAATEDWKTERGFILTPKNKLV
jgi:hypothetical protein